MWDFVFAVAGFLFVATTTGLCLLLDAQTRRRNRRLDRRERR